jgi:hypothetical protein
VINCFLADLLCDTFDTIAQRKADYVRSLIKNGKEVHEVQARLLVPDNWIAKNVLKSALRTNNNYELWNTEIQGGMGSHPAFYKIITTLNKLILANNINIERMENGVSVLQNRKDGGTDKDKRVFNFMRKLGNGDCSPIATHATGKKVATCSQ